MSDPLSVAASIVGLLTAAAQITLTLTNVAKRIKKAPKECEQARTEIADIERILKQLQSFLLGNSTTSRSRTSLILVEQVIITLATCVTTFSDLDTFVESLESDERMGLMDRIRWTMKAESLAEIIKRLQMHKTSLGVMLTILTCQTLMEAEAKVDRLCDLVEENLAMNEVLAIRLRDYEPEKLTIKATLPSNDVHNQGLRPGEEGFEPGTIVRSHVGFAFEEILMNSRAYKKSAGISIDGAFSLVSSAGRTGSWTMLSGLSLSEISHIAVLALPVYPSDLANRHYYNFDSSAIFDSVLVLDSTDREDGRPSQHTSPPSCYSLPNFFGSRGSENVDRTDDRKRALAKPVFRVALTTSLSYANISIPLMNKEGEVFMHGYIPILVARCGVLLEQNGTECPDIFALNGNALRLAVLEHSFDSVTTRYGRRVNWSGYTVHDAASLLLRYLKCLPEPVIPNNSYLAFVSPLKDWQSFQRTIRQDDNMVLDSGEHFRLICAYQRQIIDLPPSHRQLLLYLLIILAVFASKSDINRMTAERLAAIFQPGILSSRVEGTTHEEHALAVDVVQFLIENQDSFLIEMTETTINGDEEQIKQEVKTLS